MAFFVYMLASRRNGTLYIGMTDDLAKRVWQHREGVAAGFTKQYGVKTLIRAAWNARVGLHKRTPDQEMESCVEVGDDWKDESRLEGSLGRGESV